MYENENISNAFTTYSDFLAFVDGLQRPQKNLIEYMQRKKPNFTKKGYASPKMEIKFLHAIFLHIQQKHPDFECFSWNQSISNYYGNITLLLNEFRVNNTYFVESEIKFRDAINREDEINPRVCIARNEFPDPDEVNFAKERDIPLDEYGGIGFTHLNDFHEFWDMKYGSIETASLKMICLLKLMEFQYSSYYFLYVFGENFNVKFHKDGVDLTRLKYKEHMNNILQKGLGFSKSTNQRKFKIRKIRGV